MIETENTRDKLVKLGIQLMSQKGFNNTGIAEILTLARVPKGSFYHYFKSKDDLGFAIIEHYGRQIAESLEAFLSTNTAPPLTRLRRYFEWVISLFSGDFQQCNCLLGNLGQELALQHPSMRDAIFGHYQKIEALIADQFVAALNDGSLQSSVPADVLAKCLFSGWEGALVRARLEQSLDPVKQFLAIFFEQTLKR